MNKGTVVRVRAKALRLYANKERPWAVKDVIPKNAEPIHIEMGEEDETIGLYRVPLKKEPRGIIIGRTCHVLGYRYDDAAWDDEYHYNLFSPQKFIYLWLVEPLVRPRLWWQHPDDPVPLEQRWRKPWAVLDEDLTLEADVLGQEPGKIGKGRLVVARRWLGRCPFYYQQGRLAPLDDWDLPPEERLGNKGAKEVYTPPKREGLNEALYTYPLGEPILGMVIGRTYRFAGYYERNEMRQRDLFRGVKGAPAWLVEPIGLDRWLKPIAVMEEDLDLLVEA